MIRVYINWDFASPSMGVVSGIAEVHYVKEINDWTLISKFRVKCESGSTSYKSLDGEGCSCLVLDAIKPQLDSMIKAFRAGVVMSKRTYSWVDSNDFNDSIKAIEKIELKIHSGEKLHKQTEEIKEICKRS